MIPPASVPTSDTDAAEIRRGEDEFRRCFMPSYNDTADWQYALDGEREYEGES